MVTGPELYSSIRIFKWIFDNFGKKIVETATAGSWKIFKKLKLEISAADYFDNMLKQHGTMKVLGMLEPISLEGIYTNVNVLEKPPSQSSKFRRYFESYIEKLQTSKQYIMSGVKRGGFEDGLVESKIIEELSTMEIVETLFLKDASFGEILEKGKDGLSILKKKNKLFILGKPGAGKTTFLKYIVLQATKGKVNKIPIFITLRQFSESNKSLFDYIVQQFDICNLPDANPFIEVMLDKGQAIVLFDGLDEVNKEGGVRNKVIQEVVDFTNKYNKSKFVITCRIAASEYSFELFTYVEIADFNNTQINIFIKKWFQRDERMAAEFLSQINERKRLQDMSKNPLLLSLLCISFEDSMSFADRRSEVYEDAIDALLRRWDASRKIKRDELYKWLSTGRKRQMFSKIAAECFAKKQYAFEHRYLESLIGNFLKLLPLPEYEELDTRAILKSIVSQHGIFVERAKGLYTFSHLTFQEFFTARYIIENARSGTLKKLIVNHLDDERWREVFLLVAEMLHNADDFFNIFLNEISNKISQIMLQANRNKLDQEICQMGEIDEYEDMSTVDYIRREQRFSEIYKKDTDHNSIIHLEPYIIDMIQTCLGCLEVASVSNRDEIKQKLHNILS